MDNRAFNVNGSSYEMLVATLKLAFEQSDTTECGAWSFNSKYGLVLLGHIENQAGCVCNPLPVELNAQDIAPMVWSWLDSNQSFDMDPNLKGKDADLQHDGHNTRGWRVHLDENGIVDAYWSAICAIKPSYLWHGK